MRTAVCKDSIKFKDIPKANSTEIVRSTRNLLA
jgi:hypothetical protein